MNEFRFTIPGKLAGTNEIKYADRSHWSKGASLRKKDLALCADSIKRQIYKPHFSEPVAVYFAWFEPNAKRDPDNIIGGQKAILDALVACKIIPNDTQAYIKRLSHNIAVDKETPRIEVKVESWLRC